MIALHSCFIAGLTLIYCLWRDKSLFSYDMLEATQACTQCLTIFGERWPSAIKYGDLFETLSRSVLKSIMEPSSGTFSDQQASFGGDGKPRSSKATSKGSVGDGPRTSPPTMTDGDEGRNPTATGASGAPWFGDSILGAVKEVVQEVDEEAPTGWQGWRMLNDMMQSQMSFPPWSHGGGQEGMPEIQPQYSQQWTSEGQQGQNVGFTAWYDESQAASIRAKPMGDVQSDTNNTFPRDLSWDCGFFGNHE
jgi:hypothetical protein